MTMQRVTKRSAGQMIVHARRGHAALASPVELLLPHFLFARIVLALGTQPVDSACTLGKTAVILAILKILSHEPFAICPAGVTTTPAS